MPKQTLPGGRIPGKTRGKFFTCPETRWIISLSFAKEVNGDLFVPCYLQCERSHLTFADRLATVFAEQITTINHNGEEEHFTVEVATRRKEIPKMKFVSDKIKYPGHYIKLSCKDNVHWISLLRNLVEKELAYRVSIWGEEDYRLPSVEEFKRQQILNPPYHKKEDTKPLKSKRSAISVLRNDPKRSERRSQPDEKSIERSKKIIVATRPNRKRKPPKTSTKKSTITPAEVKEVLQDVGNAAKRMDTVAKESPKKEGTVTVTIVPSDCSHVSPPIPGLSIQNETIKFDPIAFQLWLDGQSVLYPPASPEPPKILEDLPMIPPCILTVEELQRRSEGVSIEPADDPMKEAELNVDDETPAKRQNRTELTDAQLLQKFGSFGGSESLAGEMADDSELGFSFQSFSTPK